MDAEKVADRFHAALREVRSAVRLPATADLTETVRAVQTPANRARRLERSRAANPERDRLVSAFLMINFS
jgi:hypothetical protein